MMQSLGLNPSGHFFVSVCIGVRPDHARIASSVNYSEYCMTNLAIFHDLAALFSSGGLGFEAFRNYHQICLVLLIPNEDRENFVARHVLPRMDQVENTYGLPLTCGVSEPTDRPDRLADACDQAECAFRLYFFEPERVIDRRKPVKGRVFNIDEYRDAQELAIRQILLQSPDAVDKVCAIVDLIANFHYGNRAGTIMQTMGYAGYVADRLKHYRLLDVDFFELQDRLQEQLIHATTFKEMKAMLRSHFQILLPRIISNDRPKGKLVVEQIKDYIQAHYMEDLSIQQLAGIAYVSPDYFSHMFKNETGKNYKAYLTEIRMTHAIELLRDTELHISEISEKVGYRNPRTFVDAFKQAYGTGPMEYRRQYRKKK